MLYKTSFLFKNVLFSIYFFFSLLLIIIFVTICVRALCKLYDEKGASTAIMSDDKQKVEILYSTHQIFMYIFHSQNPMQMFAVSKFRGRCKCIHLFHLLFLYKKT